MNRIGLLALTLALLAAACGTEAGAPSATQLPPPSTTTPPPETTTVPPSPTTSESAPTTTIPDSPTTTSPAPAPTTSAPSTTSPRGGSAPATTVPAPDVLAVAPYFYIDEPGQPHRKGPFLVPVNREIPHTKAVARATIEQLLAGPSNDEAQGTPAITTAIPSGVRLLGINIDQGLATVDFSSGFEAGAGADRFAQVVFSLTRFPNVDRVAFRVDGTHVAAPLGNGQVVSRPVGRDDYLEMAAALSVEQPTFAAKAGNPLRVTGFGTVFEASFNFALTDARGLIIAEGHAMTTEGAGWGRFDFTIPYRVNESQLGALIVWAHSAQDGSRIDVREYPVLLEP